MPDPIYLQILKTIWANSGAWPEYIEAMHRSVISEAPASTVPSESPHPQWMQLAVLCCEAAGGNSEHAQAVSLAWGLLYTAAHLMDSVADQDDVPVWMAQLGPGSMINIATGLYASSALALGTGIGDGVEPEIVAKIQNSFNLSILQMCSGQHLDLSGSFQNLDTCWQVVQAKSGAIFELACAAGAQLATDDARLISLYGEYGKHLGIMLQICDDASEIWSMKDGNQIKINFYSIPIAYTMDVLSDGERERFRASVEHSNEDARSAEMVSEMAEQAGARLYAQTKFQYHCQQAMQALRATGSRHPTYEKLVGYVNQLSLIA